MLIKSSSSSARLELPTNKPANTYLLPSAKRLRITWTPSTPRSGRPLQRNIMAPPPHQSDLRPLLCLVTWDPSRNVLAMYVLLLFIPSALVDGPEQGSFGIFGSHSSFPRATHLSTRWSIYLSDPGRANFGSNFTSSAELGDDWTHAHSSAQQWATKRFHSRLLPKSVHWIPSSIH